jgi:serine protease Do
MIDLTEFEKQITRAVETASESVVSISSRSMARTYRFGRVPVEGAGSGVIIDSNGYAITNNHVVANANGVHVDLKDGRSFEGSVVGSDPATDIALIKLNSSSNLPSAKFGDSDMLKVGQFALAIGNSLGLPGGPTVSVGVISALGRPMPWADFVFEGLIQTDAAINPGNSGGPLSDLNGNIMGINTAMIPYAQGVGFAIPSNTVKRVAEQILRNGRVIRPWLGISGVSLNRQIANTYNLGAESGVVIAGVESEGPAREAGLRGGDVIRKIGGYEIKQLRDLLIALSRQPIGRAVEIEFMRGGSNYKASLRLVEMPEGILN